MIHIGNPAPPSLTPRTKLCKLNLAKHFTCPIHVFTKVKSNWCFLTDQFAFNTIPYISNCPPNLLFGHAKMQQTNKLPTTSNYKYDCICDKKKISPKLHSWSRLRIQSIFGYYVIIQNSLVEIINC